LGHAAPGGIELSARDERRLETLHRLRLLDAPAHESFDRLTRLAGTVLNVSMTFISLLDEERDFFLSQWGFPDDLAAAREIVGDTLCRHAMQRDEPLVINDTRADEEYRGMRVVESLGVAAYVGVPLRLSNGVAIGMFCAIELEPREWTQQDVAVLTELAASAVTEIEFRDATRVARAERARYRDLVDGLDAIVWEFDPGLWRFTFVNDRAEDILGYPTSQWLTESGFWENRIVHPEDREYALQLCMKAVREGRDHEFDYRAVTADGRVIWLQDRVRVITDDTGRTALLRGVMFDITVRRKTERALAHSEERFRQLTEAIDEVFWLYDIALNRTIYVSRAFENVWGRATSEVYEDPNLWSESLHPDDRESALKLLATAQHTEYETTYRIVRPNGEVRWIHDRGFPVQNAAGAVYRTAGVARDVTVAKQTADALRESEQMFRQIAENVRELFWVFDPTFTRTIYMSPLYERMWGRSLASLYADTSTFLDAIHPDDVEALKAAMARVGQDAVGGVEYRIVLPDGSVRWMCSRGFPVRNEAGEVYRLVGTTEDVTAKRALEAERAAADAHYRRLVANAPYAIYALDSGARFTELNPAGEALLGRSARDLIGKHIAEIIAPEDLPRAQESLRRKLTGEIDVSDVEIHMLHASGARRLAHIRATAIREGGEMVGTHGIARDITDERAREEEARLLAAALHSLDEGIVIATFDGRIVYANETHARVFGYDLHARPVSRLQSFSPDEASDERFAQAMRATAEHGTWRGRISRRRLNDQRIVPIEMIMGRVDRDDGEPLLFIIGRDVSDDIRKEQHLRRAERLASVGTLIAGVAHELNNPLNSITNFATLLLETARSPEDAEDLRTIHREARRAAKIVADVRLLARETQEEVREHTNVDINDVVRHVLRTRQYTFATRNIAVRQDLAADLPVVSGDRGQIEQVVINLIVNAEQAMVANTTDRRIIVRTRATNAGVSLNIVDFGPGIPAEYLDRIFDPFFTTKTPGEGTGLGLSLVHSIVAEHGGAVNVESEIGKGTSFRVDLPLARVGDAADCPAVTQPAAPTQATDRLTILVVDDEPAIRRALSRYLTRRGHEVDVAEDGAEALRLLEASDGDHYDVILSDLRMPGLGGDELIERLRQQASGLHRRVIFLTGDAASGDAARILAALDAPVIYKPVELAELAARVERFAQEIASHDTRDSN
jgi:PAS domain S-box-containing protein